MENGIYKAISATMQDIGAVGKDQTNKSQNYKFRGIDDVMNALHPAMVKNKIFVVPKVLEQTREDRQTGKGYNLIYSICKIEYTFYAEDGSFIQAIVIGEGMDSGDKATNKAMAIAFKYACFQVFCIPTEEMQDPDAETHDVQARKKTQKTDTKSTNEKKADSGQLSSEQSSENDLIDKPMQATIEKQLVRTGVNEKVILNLYKVKKIEDMTIDMFRKAMKKFEATPDKKEDMANE